MSKLEIPKYATHYRRCSQDCCSTYYKVTDFSSIYYWSSGISKWRESRRNPFTLKILQKEAIPIKKSLVDKLMEAF